jgi:hypothetical protein
MLRCVRRTTTPPRAVSLRLGKQTFLIVASEGGKHWKRSDRRDRLCPVPFPRSPDDAVAPLDCRFAQGAIQTPAPASLGLCYSAAVTVWLNGEVVPAVQAQELSACCLPGLCKSVSYTHNVRILGVSGLTHKAWRASASRGWAATQRER